MRAGRRALYQLARLDGDALIPARLYHPDPGTALDSARQRSAAGPDRWVVLVVEASIYWAPGDDELE